MKKTWKTYVKSLTPKQKEKMLHTLLEHLLEDRDTIAYEPGGPAEYPDEPVRKEQIYWTSCGDSLLK